VSVERERASRDGAAIEELAGAPGVFGENEIGLAQHAHAAQRHVLEVADRGGDEVERSHGYPRSG
jgi:hypothetical protein